MAEVWSVPNDSLLRNTGNEWLLDLLRVIPENQRVSVLMIIWRIWHAHNEITHSKPCPSIEGSRRFLVSYLNTLLQIKQFPNADVVKGKMVLDLEKGFQRPGRVVEVPSVKLHWKKPPAEETKLNVDGSYASTGAGAGMVLRDHAGAIIFTACRELQQCRDATEAELMAIEEGLRLALHWTPKNIRAETDCAEAVELIKESTPNTSVYAFRINVIRELLRERGTVLTKISRNVNAVSHELARMGRCQHRTELWLMGFPTEIALWKQIVILS
jgi:hypothetical protein